MAGLLAYWPTGGPLAHRGRHTRLCSKQPFKPQAARLASLPAIPLGRGAEWQARGKARGSRATGARNTLELESRALARFRNPPCCHPCCHPSMIPRCYCTVLYVQYFIPQYDVLLYPCCATATLFRLPPSFFLLPPSSRPPPPDSHPPQPDYETTNYELPPLPFLVT